MQEMTFANRPAAAISRLGFLVVGEACLSLGLLAEPTPPAPLRAGVELPFRLTVAPSRSTEKGGGEIFIGNKNRASFEVVLTNVSKSPQPVWETWNSWGYQTIAFEITTADGKKHIVSIRPQVFTVNFPSTFRILPGEHQVFTITLDEKWECHPELPALGQAPIKLTAIYEVKPSDEAPKHQVWTGRVESKGYTFTLHQNP
jgi:hypothetical protein